MRRYLNMLLGCISWLATTFVAVQGQQIYNQHNVTQDVLTEYYDIPVPVKVMEYSTDLAGTIIERRLETLPEDGLPSVLVRSINQNSEEIQFVNQPPFNAEFDNGLFGSKYCVDAATLLFGTEITLKIIKEKFGWAGIDNNGINGKQVVWNILAPAKPSYIAAVKYNPILKEFIFPTNGTEDKVNHIDVVAHELVHAIIDFKAVSPNAQNLNLCNERRVLEESLCDIIGLYVLNEHEQNSPALYKWTLGKTVLWEGRPFDNPHLVQMPDTYCGNHYANVCPGDGSFIEHQNATVIDHWYYLLANGTIGTETNDLGYSYHFNGIGVNKAIQIVWNCLDHLGKYTDFNGLKKASLTVT
ncbi:M4 family metallopeptidase, partial [Dyadobacter beijingensis]